MYNSSGVHQIVIHKEYVIYAILLWTISYCIFKLFLCCQSCNNRIDIKNVALTYWYIFNSLLAGIEGYLYIKNWWQIIIFLGAFIAVIFDATASDSFVKHSLWTVKTALQWRLSWNSYKLALLIFHTIKQFFFQFSSTASSSDFL